MYRCIYTHTHSFNEQHASQNLLLWLSAWRWKRENPRPKMTGSPFICKAFVKASCFFPFDTGLVKRLGLCFTSGRLPSLYINIFFVIVLPDNVGDSIWSSVTGRVKQQEVVNPFPPCKENKKKDEGWKSEGLLARTLPAQPRAEIKCHPRRGQLPEPRARSQAQGGKRKKEGKPRRRNMQPRWWRSKGTVSEEVGGTRYWASGFNSTDTTTTITKKKRLLSTIQLPGTDREIKGCKHSV